MLNPRSSLAVIAVPCILALTLFNLCGTASAAERVLHNFNNDGADGFNPHAALLMDLSGNFYGTTVSGGTSNRGTVFELSPAGKGSWTYNVLYSFADNKIDGRLPNAALIMDPSGNLYGTTNEGGTGKGGTVFELSPIGGGTRSETILYNFGTSTGDGVEPLGTLTFDASGNLYGTTYLGGSSPTCGPGCGTIFELSPNAGAWTEKVLYSFDLGIGDGVFPRAGLVFDQTGNLYGTTEKGGAFGGGAVFELSPGVGGNWIQTVILSLEDGNAPLDRLTIDTSGNLYGTTQSGGAHAEGEVFRLSPSAGGIWTETALYNFGSASGDGSYPDAGLILDSAGNLYGTTSAGGSGSRSLGTGCGTVFELLPKAGGIWKEKILRPFSSSGGGTTPYGAVIRDSTGHLYGTALMGGTGAGCTDGCGTVFEITP